MNGKPLLSILFPVFNSEKYLEKALSSIINQSFKDWELFAIDDGSSDKSYDILEEIGRMDPRINVCRNNNNIGKVETCNRFIPLTQGIYVSVHDSDDYSQESRFEKQIAFLEKNREFSMCGTGLYFVSESGEVIKKIGMPTNEDEIRRNMFKQSQFHGPTMVIRKEVLMEIGPLYRYFRINEDIDLAVRILDNHRAVNIPECCYYYRINPYSLTKKDYTFLSFEGIRLIEILHNERKIDGRDSIMRRDWSKVEYYLEELRAPYDRDKGLVHRKATGHCLYYCLYRNAIKEAWKAIKAGPKKFVNYRLFFYCLRKSLIKGLI